MADPEAPLTAAQAWCAYAAAADELDQDPADDDARRRFEAFGALTAGLDRGWLYDIFHDGMRAALAELDLDERAEDLVAGIKRRSQGGDRALPTPH